MKKLQLKKEIVQDLDMLKIRGGDDYYNPNYYWRFRWDELWKLRWCMPNRKPRNSLSKIMRFQV